MVDEILQTGIDTQRRTESKTDVSEGGKHQILVHNDDVTPYNFVIQVLHRIFNLSHEIAEHVTWQAHSNGVAPVCSRAKAEAERLVKEAHKAARANGYPLTFTIEPHPDGDG